MSVFNITPQSSASGFQAYKWLDLSSSGQPTPASLGNITVPSNRVDQTFSFALDNSYRWIHFYSDNAGQPTARIASYDAGGNTITAGTAKTILASNADIIFCERVPAGARGLWTNFFIVGTNNDVYLVEAPSSGTTIANPTNIITDAGDAGRAEAFSTSVTRAKVSLAGTEIVICNEFNNGGTRSFVSALWTLNTAGASATYQARDVDATGEASAFYASGMKRNLASGEMFFAGAIQTGSNLRTVKVAFTSSTITNTVTSLSSGSLSLSNPVLFDEFMFDDTNFVNYILTSGAGGCRVGYMKTTGTPSIMADSNALTSGPAINVIYSCRNVDTQSYLYLANGSATTTLAFAPGYVHGTIAGNHRTNDVLTGLSATAVAYSGAISPDGQVVCYIGKDSAVTGQFYVVKL